MDNTDDIKYGKARKWIEQNFLSTVGRARFNRNDIYKEIKEQYKLKIVTTETKKNIATALEKLVKDEVIAEQQGSFYLIDATTNEIKWWEQAQGEDEISGIKFPLQLEKYCYLSNPLVGIIAGSSNSGKTATLLKTVQLNYDGWGDKIHVFCREGFSDLKQKFEWLKIPIPPKFHTYRRFDRFQDVMIPDGFNVIDYLVADADKPYAVINEIEAIFRKLTAGGVALIGMQKPAGRAFAWGGERTQDTPTFYVAIDKGKLKFVKVKKPRPEYQDNIYRQYIQFKISHGADFYDIHTGTDIEGE